MNSDTTGKVKKNCWRWSRVEEKILVNIVNHSDGGTLKRIIVDYQTNVKMTRHDAWERVT